METWAEAMGIRDLLQSQWVQAGEASCSRKARGGGERVRLPECRVLPG